MVFSFFFVASESRRNVSLPMDQSRECAQATRLWFGSTTEPFTRKSFGDSAVARLAPTSTRQRGEHRRDRIDAAVRCSHGPWGFS